MDNKNTGKILVVDDEEAIRFFMADSLAEEGWDVTESDSGEAALVALSEERYDIILLDLRMPGIDGLVVMQEVKKQWPETMIIIMTGYASIDSAIEAVRHGAFDYLRKPCTTSDVIDCVKRAFLDKQTLDRQRELTHLMETEGTIDPDKILPTGKYVRTGKLTIHLDSRTVLSSGKSLPLTPTEYELLAILARSIGQPVSLSQLIGTGLGYDAEDPQAQETLRVHISRLRNKIGTKYVLTIRGGGYVLVNIYPTGSTS
jgi:DNA-binding response OmpR family regulator